MLPVWHCMPPSLPPSLPPTSPRKHPSPPAVAMAKHATATSRMHMVDRRGHLWLHSDVLATTASASPGKCCLCAFSCFLMHLQVRKLLEDECTHVHQDWVREKNQRLSLQHELGLIKQQLNHATWDLQVLVGACNTAAVFALVCCVCCTASSAAPRHE